MIRIASLQMGILISVALLLQGCLQEKCTTTHTYTAYTPVFMSYDEIRGAVASGPVQDLTQPGKIFIKGDWLFVNEAFKGIHVIDNSNPTQPNPVGFITIPGNIDLAVRGNYLYADSYMDLVTMDITDPTAVVEVDRKLDVLPTHAVVHPDSGVIIDYLEHLVTEEYDCNLGGGIRYDMVTFESTAAMNMGSTAGTPGPPASFDVPGLGGSMARFSLVGNHLYLIDARDMHAYDVTQSAQPNFSSTQNVGFNIETLWHYNNRLFIGAQNGMYIYDISNNPAQPQYLSFYGHVNSCDPVVVKDDIAYVTLRSGTQCQGFTNQLEIIDIADVTNPTLLYTYPMHNPHGLGIDGNTLFICDNDQGLKVYDASDVSVIDQHLTDHIGTLTAFDVIPVFYEDLLILTGPDGIYQFDYSDPADLQQLSHLPITP